MDQVKYKYIMSGSVMVKALCYKPEGCGFHTQWGEFLNLPNPSDRLCGLVVRVLGYRSGGPGSIPGTSRFSGGGGGTVVGLEQGPLSLMSTTEELLDSKVAAPV
jgi:hypothetical protein